MPAALKSSELFLGRMLLSAIFLLSGTMKLMHWEQTAGTMEAKGMPAVPFLLLMAVLFELGGGLSVLLGLKARWGAAALIIFLIPATLVFHNFWTQHGQEMQNQMQHFMKNLTIMGGLTVLAGAGAGAYSLDAVLARKRAQREGLATDHARAAMA